MNAEKIIEKLAAKARRETPPQVNVADHVMEVVKTLNVRQVIDDRPMWWVAGFAAAAAMALGFLAINVWHHLPNVLLRLSIEAPWEVTL